MQPVLSAADLQHLEPDQLTELGSGVKREHLRRRQAYRTCEHCGTNWLARADARYCQPRCRLAAFRDRERATK